MEENKEIKKSNNSLVIVLLVIIIALGAYIAYSEYRRSNDKEIITETKEEKKEEKIDHSVDEGKIKEKIIKMLNCLETKDSTKKTYDVMFFIFPWDNFLNNKLTENDKALITLVTSEFEQLPENDPRGETIDSTLTLSDYEKNYYYYFGTNPQLLDIKITLCPNISYNKNNKLFYETDRCGYGRPERFMIYFDSYKFNGDTGSAIIYIGSTEKNPIVNSDNGTYITESNKTSFPKYLFNFKKATDGNFYFENVTKAS